MTPELAYEKRYADVDNGAHTWAVAPQHVKDMWLAAWTISDSVNREDERQRWTDAVMLELDSNGQAHAIVAAATRA
jgi:hypothetical protein